MIEINSEKSRELIVVKHSFRLIDCLFYRSYELFMVAHVESDRQFYSGKLKNHTVEFQIHLEIRLFH